MLVVETSLLVPWAWPLTAAVVAHVLYGLPRWRRDEGATTIALHNGDAFSESDEPPRPDRLASVRVIDRRGSVPLAVNAQAGGAGLRVSPVESAWVVAETPPVPIELPGDRFEHCLAHEGLTAVLEARRAAGDAARPGREAYSQHIKIGVVGPDGRRDPPAWKRTTINRSPTGAAGGRR
jgi:hypothetical protein